MKLFRKIAIVTLVILSLLILITSKLHKNKNHKKITHRLKSEIKTFTSRFTFNYSDKIPSTWNLRLGIAFRNMAALGYVTADSAKRQLEELQKEFPTKISIQNSNFSSVDERSFLSPSHLYPYISRAKSLIWAKNFKSKVSHLFRHIFGASDWDHVFTYTDKGNYKYSWTIIKSDVYKKIILSFSGTKEISQLIEEAINSGASKFFRTSKSHPYLDNVMVMNYFQDLYKVIYTEVEKYFFETLKGREDYEVIFCGHSLGGAMASIALFDMNIRYEMNQQNPSLLKRLNLSLFTYGQPRTGNYAFANEINKATKVIYRHVNDNDVVAKVPGCMLNTVKNKDICVHEFDEKELQNGNYKKLDKQKFYPWHIRGLVAIRGDISDYDTCKECYSCPQFGENSNDDKCRLDHALTYTEFHSYYFNYQVGIGDWGLGIGDWAQSPIPNPQSPIPNPQSPLTSVIFNVIIKI
jgi:hypothetical protein